MTMRSDVDPGEDSRSSFADKKIVYLQQEYGDVFYRLARSRGLCHLDALNVVQMGLLAMRDRLVRKGPVGNDLSYFRAVMKNQITQFYRDRKNAKEKPRDVLEELLLTADKSDDQQSNETWPLGKHRMLCVANQAVQELSDPHREVYELAVIAGMEPADIAQMLEKKPGTVRTYLCQARVQVEARANELLADLELREKHCGEK